METVLLLVDVQFLTTLFLVVLLWSFHARLRKQEFFRWWAWAWTLFAVHLAAGAVSLRLGPQWTVFKGGLLFSALLTGMIEIPLIFFGAWSLRWSRALPRNWVRVAIGVAAAAAVLSLVAAFVLRQQPLASFMVRTTPRVLALSAAFLYCGMVFFWRWRSERSWAAITTGVFCLLYGLDQGFYGVQFANRLINDLLTPARQLFDISLSLRTELLLFDLACNFGICLGMVLFLAEEHQHTEHALKECNIRGREMAVNNAALHEEISERMRLEHALQESEAKFRSLAETVACGIWMYRGTRFLYFNPMVSAVTGYSAQELSSMDIWEVVHPDCRETVRQRGEKRLRGEPTPSRYEFKILTRSGEERWLDFTARLVDFNGEPVVLGTAFDVTEKKQAEAALRRSEETLAKIFHASPNILTLMTAQDLRYLKVNAAFERATGYHSEEVVGHTWPELGLWEETQEREKVLRRIRSEGNIRNARWEFHDREGKAHSGLLSSEEVQIAGERCFLVAVVDITAVKQAKEKAREASQLYREIFESSEDGIIISTLDGKVLDANPAAARILGYSRPEMMALGRKGLLGKSDPRPVQEFLDRRARDGAASGEIEVTRKDGARILTEAFSRLFQDQEGQQRATVVIRDITARKRAEQALATVGRRLIAAQEQERTRIARELHDDINQRIALLSIELQHLRQDINSDHEIRKKLEAACRQTSEIGTDIQAISHRLHPSKLEYLGLVAASGSYCRETSEQHRVMVNFVHEDIPDSLPWEVSLCVFRVLQEALSNAVKHSGVRRFEVELSGNDGQIRLKVRDSGIGFDPSLHLDNGGIGLASMRERVAFVGGRISIQSRPGNGTIIQADVPINTAGVMVERRRLSA